MFIGVLSIFSSCGKHGVYGEFFLSEEIKHQNPYTENTKLSFKSNDSNLFDYNVTALVNEVNKSYVGQRTDLYYLVEREIIMFEFDSGYIFRLEMVCQINQTPMYFISYQYKEKGMSASFELPLNIERTPYIDSLYVLDTWVHDVFFFEGGKIDDRAYKLYYSTKFGVVKIDFSDDSYWELENIE